MANNDKLKQSLYFPDDVLRDIMAEAIRLDRSLSWMVQHAWRIAREEVRTFPAAVRPSSALYQPSPRPVGEPQPEKERLPSRQVREFLRGKFDKELTSRESSLDPQ
jgi:uncharacterized small protein (TIGR04563 family)